MILDVITEVFAAAAETYPAECCGIVVLLPDTRLKVIKCTNTDPEPTKAFSFDCSHLHAAEAEGEVQYIYHSHPDGVAVPSTEDIIQAEELGYPFLIVSVPDKAYVVYRPKGYELDLVGRPFIYGVYDCLTLGRDYYLQKLGIKFEEPYPTQMNWWKDPAKDSLYLTELKRIGFSVVSDGPKPNDIILMQVLCDQPNHIAVYLGDGHMMHHLYGRNSELAVYGGPWEKITRAILRYKDFL